MPIQACRLIRKMRGGAQAHLIEAEDGRFYVVKFRNNPQHRRILVNEMLSAALLGYLQIRVPDVAIVDFSPDFLRSNPDLCIQLGTRRIPVEPGWHFGSCFPGHPEHVAVYDFLPDALFDKVENRDHFLGTLVFDKWAGNADSRQAIFYRARLRHWAPGNRWLPAKTGFLAEMIDHGYVFDGPAWDFSDSPIQGLYFRQRVYSSVRSLDDFQPWLDRVVSFPEEVIDDAWRRIPAGWLDKDEAELERLLTRLLARRRRVPDLIENCRQGRINPFPNW
ncbi:MAG: hypothetical protein IT160_00190 [Bryobacterales bacterium]|nr:hypothetical protein [Bryobacterales bacterium]